MFKNAIVRTPGHNFAEGLTTVTLGQPQFNKVLEQHVLYCEALQHCGLHITTLDPDLQFPDSTFVEDTAVLTSQSAILTNPGAPSREGEVAAIAPALSTFFSSMPKIESPGTLDGGDFPLAAGRAGVGEDCALGCQNGCVFDEGGVGKLQVGVEGCDVEAAVP